MALLEAADLAALAELKAEFDEGAHPRDDHGKFTSGGGFDVAQQEPSRIGKMVRGDANHDKLYAAMLGTIGSTRAYEGQGRFEMATDAERNAAKAAIVERSGAALARAASEDPAVRAEFRAQYPEGEAGRTLLEQDYYDTWQDTSGFPDASTMTDEELYGVGKAQAYVDAWAATAADSDPVSQALQLATADELDAHSKSFESYIEPMGDPEQRAATAYGVYEDREGATMRAFVRDEYDATQSMLRSAGIGPNDYVSLYRGVHYGMYEGPSPFKQDGVYRAEMNPSSSWSLDKFTATSFSFGLNDESSNSFLLSAQVKGSDIISTARTGRGALNEGEVLVRNPTDGLDVYANRQVPLEPFYDENGNS